MAMIGGLNGAVVSLSDAKHLEGQRKLSLLFAFILRHGVVERIRATTGPQPHFEQHSVLLN